MFCRKIAHAMNIAVLSQKFLMNFDFEVESAIPNTRLDMHFQISIALTAFPLFYRYFYSFFKSALCVCVNEVNARKKKQ